MDKKIITILCLKLLAYLDLLVIHYMKGATFRSYFFKNTFITGKIQSTTSLDSYTYSVTPGISAAGVWPSSPKSPSNDSYVICHRDQGEALHYFTLYI